MRPIRNEALRRRVERKRRAWRPGRLLVVLPVCVFLCVFVVELGRGFFAMREVEQFASRIEQTPPADVKRQLEKFSADLADLNPLVRNASISAMKVATGKNLAPMAGAWIAWWKKNGDTWQYQPPGSQAVPAPAQQSAQQ